MTTVALIGLGSWGKILLEQLNELFDIAACCNEQDSESQDWVKAKYPSVNCTFDLDSVLNDPKIEAIVVATPIAKHFQITEKALLHGKHVFVEKPLADNVADAQHIVDLAKQKNLALFPGHVFLYDAAIQHLASLITDDPPVEMEMRWTKYGTFKEGLEWNLLCHDISIALTLFGETPPEESPAPIIRIHRQEQNVIDIELVFSRNRVCRITIDRYMPHSQKLLKVVTEDARTMAWYPGVLYEVTPSEVTKLHESSISSVAQELEAFLKVVRLGVFDADRAEHGLQVVKTIAQITNAFKIQSSSSTELNNSNRIKK
ncbi:Gfo/Idh/MocA family protein [Candidatus Lucifugimonas marina]|uniref:Gfo/Idh/MocA-like oxidoreductase N-terminal domain-containing protein n=1 Tax=Candidatus Lucifugimonas marina TaxID=3038979 RepID=A0AAJ5ZCU5_9CHLR|nr:hypothetical protein [SAR202 cluster bacterium JH702]MDG0868279.1 hypothetical protein [SAR202 cluster bacterium JH639]WFG34923.1 hypothetical protein GKN94_04210 [SAR202 cluster bacterium JH545]WFG38874.1 hypothetical protein GKO48_04345 [SAR202 cluster bacterium JH1073]